jgi:hypothetical protein
MLSEQEAGAATADVPALQRPMARFAHWSLGLVECIRRR